MVIIHPEARIFIAIVTLVWAGFLGYLASVPWLPHMPFVPLRAVEPLAHYGTFFVLAGLAYLVASPKPSHLSGRVRTVAVVVAFSVVMALFLERLQLFFPARTLQLSDIIFNAAGAVTGAIAVFILDQLNVSRHSLSVAISGVVVLLIVGTGASISIWNPS